MTQDIERLVTTDKPYIRLEISREGFFRGNMPAMGGRDLQGMARAVRTFLGCQLLVTGDDEQLQALFMPQSGGGMPTEADLRHIFPAAGAISYRNCPVPARSSSFMAAHIDLEFIEPVASEIVPPALTTYLDGLGWVANWEDSPAGRGRRMLTIWPKSPGQGWSVGPDPRHMEELLENTGWQFTFYAFNVMTERGL